VLFLNVARAKVTELLSLDAVENACVVVVVVVLCQ
jgi:hypothetical protein